MRVYLSLIVWLVIGFSIPVSAAAKDLTLRQRVTSANPQNPPYDGTKYLTADRIVTDSPATRTIIDLEAETITMINMREQTYFIRTFAEARQEAENSRAQSQKTMDKLGLGPPTSVGAVAAKPTGKSDTIAGYAAKEYAIEAGPISASVWATTALQPPGGAKARQAAVKMTAPESPSGSLAQAMAQIEGVVLRTSIRTGSAPQNAHNVTEVLEVIATPPPAEVLNVPAGFTKTAPAASEPPKAAEKP